MSEAKSIEPKTNAEFEVLVVEREANRIFFGSTKKEKSDQVSALRSPDAEDFYVAAAREKLNMASAGISQQSLIYVDKDNKIVNPKSSESGKQSSIESRPVWVVVFDSLFGA